MATYLPVFEMTKYQIPKFSQDFCLLSTCLLLVTSKYYVILFPIGFLYRPRVFSQITTQNIKEYTSAYKKLEEKCIFRFPFSQKQFERLTKVSAQMQNFCHVISLKRIYF